MRRLHAPFGPWDPAPAGEVAALFEEIGAPWWLAGGIAIELAVGRRLRAHGDIDVMVLRRDQTRAQQALRGWELWAADPPGSLRPWAAGEPLAPGVHDIWCRPGPDAPWRIQLMLEESEGAAWVSRRDARVSRPLDALGFTTGDGTPVVVPEVQLHYKAKGVRPKDELDFDAALPHLAREQRRWLADALTTTYGAHPWAARL
ncbi:nucleotidyltransferase domain-containing protein [Streptomyces longispororuber]|uniref:nucleotidyltransferase domain-containing protein n=1 Tax=Streptomyces longispororuber TaxID=68230 RepID=UPI0021087A3F|nr:amino acid transporter [Streptomyces longispororuber]MCQ4209613.1 amino acid transporter [Streptomyces longispororuber]